MVEKRPWRVSRHPSLQVDEPKLVHESPMGSLSQRCFLTASRTIAAVTGFPFCFASSTAALATRCTSCLRRDCRSRGEPGFVVSSTANLANSFTIVGFHSTGLFPTALGNIFGSGSFGLIVAAVIRFYTCCRSIPKSAPTLCFKYASHVSKPSSRYNSSSRISFNALPVSTNCSIVPRLVVKDGSP
jgi:hypothetical protein